MQLYALKHGHTDIIIIYLQQICQVVYHALKSSNMTADFVYQANLLSRA